MAIRFAGDEESLSLALHMYMGRWESADGVAWKLPDVDTLHVLRATGGMRATRRRLEIDRIGEQVWAAATYLAWPYDKQGVVHAPP